jgi:hypothetical protein
MTSVAPDPGNATSPERRARRLWRLLEPIHALVYFTPDARARFEAAGLKGFWMGYFASRSAPLGPVGPEVVEALFYVFHPAMVSRALPDAWTLSSPEVVLEVRYQLAEDTLRQALGELAESDEVARAAELAVAVAKAAPRAGRPLAAAWAALPVPPADQPLRQLWWAATVLREHRGDGHMSSLLQAGIGPCAALVLAGAAGGLGPDGAAILQAMRRWPDADWQAATRDLTDRGWLDSDVALTDAGRAAHRGVEDATDRLAAEAFAARDEAEIDTLISSLRPLARRVADSGIIPIPNPIGLDPSPDQT